MLQYLYIKNYILIDEQELNFGEGFTVLTGETGAGKSILLGALNLLLGRRAENRIFKDSSKKCIIEAGFRYPQKNLSAFFEENDLDPDDSIVIRREFTPAGKNRAFINDTPVGLQALKLLGDYLMDIHSQDEKLLLGTTGFQLSVIDSYSGTVPLVSKYREKFKRFRSLTEQLARLLEEQKEALREHDYLSFLLNELEEAQPRTGEQQELEDELNELEHAEEIKGSLFEVSALLDGEDSGILHNLQNIRSLLGKISSYGQEFKEFCERLSAILIDLNELSRDISHRADSVEYSPERLEKARERLDLLFRLQQRHQVNHTDELPEVILQLREKIGSFRKLDAQIDEVGKEAAQYQKEVETLAQELHKQRIKNLKGFCREVESILADLGMQSATLDVQADTLDQPGPDGIDKLDFLFTANRGKTPEPIRAIASGGEKSRVMLAIKSVIAEKNILPTIIFDEIDTGVSGVIADKMGEILRKMSLKMQVIAITHLPQIAARGQHHMMVYKEDGAKSTETRIRLLSGEERVIEIAKLFSGSRLTESSLESARMLLKN
ncbi:MAG: DNA repair protein RecN [Bacteroidales bacterium]